MNRFRSQARRRWLQRSVTMAGALLLPVLCVLPVRAALRPPADSRTFLSRDEIRAALGARVEEMHRNRGSYLRHRDEQRRRSVHEGGHLPLPLPRDPVALPPVEALR